MKAVVYECKCSSPIAPERVRTIELDEEDQRVVIVEYVCDCSPKKVNKRRFQTNPRALHSIVEHFPGKPRRLPWTSPFKAEAIPSDDLRLKSWRWELEQVGSADEFIEFLEGHAQY